MSPAPVCTAPVMLVMEKRTWIYHSCCEQPETRDSNPSLSLKKRPHVWSLTPCQTSRIVIVHICINYEKILWNPLNYLNFLLYLCFYNISTDLGSMRERERERERERRERERRVREWVRWNVYYFSHFKEKKGLEIVFFWVLSFWH